MITELPEYARVVRNLPCGLYPYLQLLPRFAESPTARRVATDAMPIGPLLDTARVRIKEGEGFCFVDIAEPAIILFADYYRQGNVLDLYMDLAHELTHLRQLAEGKDLWDAELHYVDRPTEIEGYAVAVEEGVRLGMTDDDVYRHLSNPWLSPAEVARLRRNIDRFLAEKL